MSQNTCMALLNKTIVKTTTKQKLARNVP